MLFHRRESDSSARYSIPAHSAVPPIDLAVPNELSTATFGVG